MTKFKIVSDFGPTGDQPTAIDEMSSAIDGGAGHQTLMGVTGSGKTFTMACVVEKVQKPTLVIAHNKTLAAQLATEFKEFSRKMLSNISLVITITINQRLTFPELTRI